MPPRWEPSLDDYVDVAVYLLGADRAAVTALPRISLVEADLRAPFASFGGVEAYPTLVEQAAVLLEHLTLANLYGATSWPENCVVSRCFLPSSPLRPHA